MIAKFQSPDERGGYCDTGRPHRPDPSMMRGFNPLTSGAGTATSPVWSRLSNARILFQSPDERGGYCDTS